MRGNPSNMETKHLDFLPVPVSGTWNLQLLRLTGFTCCIYFSYYFFCYFRLPSHTKSLKQWRNKSLQVEPATSDRHQTGRFAMILQCKQCRSAAHYGRGFKRNDTVSAFPFASSLESLSRKRDETACLVHKQNGTNPLCSARASGIVASTPFPLKRPAEVGSQLKQPRLELGLDIATSNIELKLVDAFRNTSTMFPSCSRFVSSIPMTCPDHVVV